MPDNFSFGDKVMLPDWSRSKTVVGKYGIVVGSDDKTYHVRPVHETRRNIAIKYTRVPKEEVLALKEDDVFPTNVTARAVLTNLGLGGGKRKHRRGTKRARRNRRRSSRRN